MPAPAGNTFAQGHKGGRPSKYQQAYAHHAYHYCLMGATDNELAAFFEVDVSTLYEWRRRYAAFSDAVKRGKMWADAQIAHALFKKAMGFNHPQTKFIVVSSGDHKQAVVTREIIKYYPPDVTALKFWLTNRQAHLWRDKPVVDMTERGTRLIRRDEASGNIIIEMIDESGE
ncbi:hypothetical protein GCM10027299_09280 [Larkinella ripae]